SKRIGCTWHLNLSKPTKNNLLNFVYITTFINEHSHELLPKRLEFIEAKKFTDNMVERVLFYAKDIGLNPRSIKRALEKEFPDYPIYAQDLHSILQQYQLAEVLETQIRKKDKNTQYLYWKTNIPNTFAIKVSQELFLNIDELLICFLSPTILKIQQDEIKKALIY
ncbi:4221_t:CDS:2, partial [Gigaspora rosea]